MMNQDNPYAMNQTCKVCGEPAAGFHFGAFTCEGCKSFFGRSYNNLSSISDCKNNGECIINKKNRTACKACRLRKCLLVGMSKSGSRYGRRSNWFKIHCLLQEQQQQAAAAMAAHHNNQQQAVAAMAAAQHGGSPLMSGHKPPPHGMSPHGPPGSAAAAAALGMLGHAGAYPGLYPPRTKEELLMLGLEEYAAAAAAAKHTTNPSPSVSSPDSHNSDNSLDVSTRGTNAALLHLGGKHGSETGGGPTHGPPPPPQLRKDLPHFLPLPFGGLGSMPVMPPPAFLPPSHLLFPGYHPALYSHHQGLLKTSAEQQQQAAAAAAAVQQLFNPNNAAPSRFPPALQTPTSPLAPAVGSNKSDGYKDVERVAQSPKSGDALNNNHLPNGSKAAEELTKRFYLDAVLKSQRNSPPPAATKLPAHPKHDHSISALVTPNSESGRERLRSRQSNEDDEDVEERESSAGRLTISAAPANDARSNLGNGNGSGDGDSARVAKEHSEDEDDEEELVVSMTPPRSPANTRAHSIEGENVSTAAITNTTNTLTPAVTPTSKSTLQQDNPIDLSMKTNSSVASSSLSSKCSSTGSVQASDSDNEIDCTEESERVANSNERRQKYATVAEDAAEEELLQVDGDELDSEISAIALKLSATSRKQNKNKNSSNNNNNKINSNNNTNNNSSSSNNSSNSTKRRNSSDNEEYALQLATVKRKISETAIEEASNELPYVKRSKLAAVTVVECASDERAPSDVTCAGTTSKVVANSTTPTVVAPTTTPLDLTLKV